MSMMSVGLEGPDERLDPGDGGEKPGPAHQVDGLGVRVLARDGDPPRQPREPDQKHHECDAHEGERSERQVVQTSR